MDISERPAVVGKRCRVGNWEVGTIIGAGHKGVIVSLVDRKSKYALLQGIERKTAVLVGGATIDMREPVKGPVHTFTADNGKQFAGHPEFAAALDAEVYFARPYRSCERGLNEQIDGLVRLYFGRPESLLDAAPKIRLVVDLLNGGPRKALGSRTPAEVFAEAVRASA